MPKLNVKQNNSNVIKAFQVALETGHRNLLDNPFFSVNQRNATSVSTNGDYIADRWRCTYGSGGYTATRNSDGSITLTPGSASSHATMYQILEQSLVTALNAKTVTVSVLMQDGTIRSGTQTFSATGNRTFFAATSASPIQVDWNYSTRGIAIRSYYRAGTIRAVKLELGSYSTLANDVPPDYGEELAKCQRHFVRMRWQALTPVCLALASTSTNLNGLIITPVAMRETSTYSIAYSGSLTTPAGNTATPTNVTASYGNQMRVQFSASGITSGQMYQLHTGNAAKYIDISTDI